MSSSLSSGALKEIRDRVDAATPGPWEDDLTCIDGEYAVRRFVTLVPEGESDDDADVETYIIAATFDDEKMGNDPVDNGEANARFIAHARTDIPRLLDTVEELARENEKLQKTMWECEACGFGMDAVHTNADGSYTCPVCENERLKVALADAERAARYNADCAKDAEAELKAVYREMRGR